MSEGRVEIGEWRLVNGDWSENEDWVSRECRLVSGVWSEKEDWVGRDWREWSLGGGKYRYI